MDTPETLQEAPGEPQGEEIAEEVAQDPSTPRRGRKKGSKDKKKRKPPNYDKFATAKNLPAVTAPGRMSKRDMLFKQEIETYGFKTAWEIFNFFNDLKTSLDKAKESNDGVLPIDKQTNERAGQIIDLLKFIASHEFVRVKAIDLNPQQSDRVVLNFNLTPGEQQAQQQATVKPEKEEILDLFNTPAGFALPITKQ